MGLKWKKNEIIVTLVYWDRIHTDLLPRLDHMYAKAINARFQCLCLGFLKFKVSFSVGYAVADQEDQINPGSY